MNTQEISPLSILSLFETTKAERQSFVAQVVYAINEGHIDPRKVHLQIKGTEELLNTLKEQPDYKDALLKECQKEGKKHDFFNASFEVTELGTKYNYAACNDPLYAELEAQAKAANDKLKERQEFLKKIPLEGIEVRHEDELVQVYPPSKYSTTGIKVSLK